MNVKKMLPPLPGLFTLPRGFNEFRSYHETGKGTIKILQLLTVWMIKKNRYLK